MPRGSKKAKKHTQHALKADVAFKRGEQIERSKDFLEKAKRWGRQNEIASALAWQLYTKALAYLDEGGAKNAHRFYDLTMKALRLCSSALKELNLEEFEKRLQRLEMQIGEA